MRGPDATSAGQEWDAEHGDDRMLSLIHISEPTRPLGTSYAVFCLKKKNCASEKRM